MTERYRQGWQAPCVPLLMIAGLCPCLCAFHCRAEDTPASVRDAPPPPPAVKQGEAVPTAQHPDSLNRPLPSDPEDELLWEDGDAIDTARLASIRTALNPLLIRDRRHRLLLKRGDESLQHGDASEGIAHFQALLDAPQDAFFWTSISAHPHGAQANVVLRLHELPEAGRRTYQRLHGPAACLLLDRYGEAHDRRVLFELLRRYGHTDAAREAALRELLTARDAGRAALAAEWGRVLISDSYHWRQLSPELRALIAEHHRNSVMARTASVAAELSRTQSVSEALVSPARSDANTGETSPPFPVPLWTAPFDAFDSPPHSDSEGERTAAIQADIRTAVHDWLADRVEGRLPIASANEALVIGDTLVVRDFGRLRAFELSTGRSLWTYPCTMSLAAFAALRLEEQRGKSGAGSLDFEAMFSGNPVFGRLATDGSRVFLLDQVRGPTADSNLRSTTDDGLTYAASSPVSHRPNQLAALPILIPQRPTDRPVGACLPNEPLWTRGTQSTVADDELTGHAFLGRPLCVDDRLFILAEFDRQISLWALDAATGETLWRQGVALVNQSAAADTLRSRTACSPVYSQGIVACPTEVGVVVGVDALTGRLQWVYDHLDEDQRSNSGRWTFAGGARSDRQPLPNHALVHGGRLIYLTRRSAFVHCIDLQTGTAVWTAPKEESYAVGGAVDALVLLLGDRECRALRFDDGGQLWRTIVPEPAGLGLTAGNRYLLPTSNGPCLSIRLDSGEIEGGRFSRLLHEVATASDSDGRRPGDAAADAGDPQTAELLSILRASPAGTLLAGGDRMIAVTPLGVSVFSQARPALQQLQSTGVVLSDADLLKQSQLLLTLGEAAAAAHTLEKLLTRRPVQDIEKPAERLLGEILYAQLERAADPRELLARIALLDNSDEQRLRLLLCQVDVALTCEDPELLVAAVDQFQTQPPTGLQTIDGYQVAPEQCLWERLSRLREDGPAELQHAIRGRITRQASLLLEEQDAEKLEQFVTLFAGWESAGAVRVRLARHWTAAGRLQEAELLLLGDRFSHEPEAADDARQQLDDLYARGGVSARPANLRPARLDGANPIVATPGARESTTRNPGVAVIGTALVSLHPDAHESRLHRTAFGPPPDAPRVQIVEHLCGEGCPLGETCACERVRDWHQSTRRRFIPKRTGNLLVLDRGPTGHDKSESRLLIADRDLGVIRGDITVPAAYWQTPSPLTAETGHVMVIGGETAFGLSLLEGKLLWAGQPGRSGKRLEKFKVGPIGSDYCVLQTSRELRVVHPATGQTLWVRSDLPPGIGLEAHDATGVIGDSETLAVFDADQTAFTVYHTQSGRLLRRAERPPTAENGRRQRRAVGRRR
ncbi:MAG: PQQ-binding-like beta-propeller repeat protein, partial [Planctomycetaceae bacterium]